MSFQSKGIKYKIGLNLLSSQQNMPHSAYNCKILGSGHIGKLSRFRICDVKARKWGLMKGVHKYAWLLLNKVMTQFVFRVQNGRLLQLEWNSDSTWFVAILVARWWFIASLRKSVCPLYSISTFNSPLVNYPLPDSAQNFADTWRTTNKLGQKHEPDWWQYNKHPL